jgi:SNF2 family DNA or RNA helicase
MKMIERASHKLALDKAVLGSHGTSTQLSKKEVERLLKEGAYDFFTDQVELLL